MKKELVWAYSFKASHVQPNFLLYTPEHDKSILCYTEKRQSYFLSIWQAMVQAVKRGTLIMIHYLSYLLLFDIPPICMTRVDDYLTFCIFIECNFSNCYFYLKEIQPQLTWMLYVILCEIKVSVIEYLHNLNIYDNEVCFEEWYFLNMIKT